MKINVKVKTNAKQAKVARAADGAYNVHVKAKPVEGKANEAVRGALAEHFGIPRFRITLILGRTSKYKIFEVGT